MPDELPPIQSSQRFRVPGITTKNLSIVITGLVVIVALLKAKKGDVPKIVETIFGSHLFAVVGWTLAIVILLASVVLIKIIVRFYDKEMNRISKERDHLQTRLLKKLEE